MTGQQAAPAYLRLEHGSEFTAKAVREWPDRWRVPPLFIEPGSPWEDGYLESFNGKLRDELLNMEVFATLVEAQVLAERWRRRYNTVGPQTSLGYRPPAPEAVQPWARGLAALSPPAQGCSGPKHRIGTGSVSRGRPGYGRGNR